MSGRRRNRAHRATNPSQPLASFHAQRPHRPDSCIPTQMPRNGMPSLCTLRSIASIMPSIARQSLKTMRKGSNAGQHNPVGVGNHIRIGSNNNIRRPRRFQRIMHRMQIARAIINQRSEAGVYHGLERDRLPWSTECPFGGGDSIGLARINFDRLTQRARQGLVAAFDNMVVVRPVEIFDMQRNASSLSQNCGTSARSTRCPIRPDAASTARPSRQNKAAPKYRARNGSKSRPSAHKR